MARGREPVQPQWKDKAVAAAAQMAIIRFSLRRLAASPPRRLAAGRRPRPRVPALFALVLDRQHRWRALARYAGWLGRRPDLSS
jgi:hypothetical protein